MNVDQQSPVPSDALTQLTQRIADLIGRPLTDREVELARDLANEKTPELIARELQGAPITDPKKIRPEHKDTADE